LNPIEEARGFKQLMDDYGLTQEEAPSASVSPVRPWQTPFVAGSSLKGARTSFRKASQCRTRRALLTVRDWEKQQESALLVIAREYSVRQTEILAARLRARRS
jgi:ParB family chromosome partitioning protein